MVWNRFLEDIAAAHGLVGDDKQAFLARFAQENLQRSDVLLLDDLCKRLEISEVTLRRRLARVYHTFATSCPALQMDKKGKFKRLRDWLEEEYRHYEKTGELTTIAKFSKEPPTLLVSENDVYVKRPLIESQCYQSLLQPGSLLRIKALRQMGKTCLMTRVLSQLEIVAGYRCVILSFKLADRTLYHNLNTFLRWFCTNVSRELHLESGLDDYWEAEAGSKTNCTSYFEEYLLPETESPLALCLDDVDLIFPYPEIYEDFFRLLRFWHERANSRPIWQKLRLVVVHSTEVYIPLNIHQSPFNVGVPMELPELTAQQVQDFSRQHGLDLNPPQIEQLMAMVGGHPDLLRQAFYHLKHYPKFTVENLLTMAATETGMYGNHLRELWLLLQEDAELAAAFKTVVTATTRVQLKPMQAYQLDRMGLVQISGNGVQPRCQLYRQYFSQALGDGG